MHCFITARWNKARWAVLQITAGSILTSASTTTPLGDYIALGLGESASSTTSAFVNVSTALTFSNASSPLVSTSPSTPTQRASSNRTTVQTTSTTVLSPKSTVGIDLRSAESCLLSLSSFYMAQQSFYDSIYSTVDTSYTSTSVGTITSVDVQFGVDICSDVTSLTTLCDGHPRVVGSGSCWTGSTSYGYTLTETMLYQQSIATFSTPTPCSVNPAVCQSIYALNSSYVTLPSPMYGDLCVYSTSQTQTLSTNSLGLPCDDCYIVASAARLLYWPVRTQSITGNDNLCNATSIKILTGTPTGTGPNTYVTEGVTITSPSVGIWLGGVSRGDGCFATVSSTILVVPSSEVTSVRGARALFTMEPFAYQDLNYRCQAAGSDQYIIQDEPGDDCYQEVPATAYFGDRIAFDDWNADGRSIPTISRKMQALTSIQYLHRST